MTASEPPRSGIRCVACTCAYSGPYGRRIDNCKECEPCTDYAVIGDTRCSWHGGDPDSKHAQWRWSQARQLVGWGAIGDKALRKNVARQEEVSRLGAPRAIDPGEALLEEVARAAGHVAYLREKCEDLEESELVWQQVMQVAEQQQGDGETAGSYTKMTATHAHEINKWWDMYTRERDHLVKVATATLKAGVDERRVRLAEKTSAAMGQVAENIARDLGYDPSDAKVAAIIGKRFRELLSADAVPTGHGDAVAQPASSTPPTPVIIDGSTNEDGSVDF